MDWMEYSKSWIELNSEIHVSIWLTLAAIGMKIG